MKKLIFLISLLLVSFTNVAEAKPKHKKHHYIQTKITTPSQDDGTASSFFAMDKARDAVVSTYRNTERTIQYSGSLVSKAYTYVGSSASQLGLPSRLWCADFMNMIAGGTDRRAISFIHRGKSAPYGCTNCVAVTKRKGGSHVGVVSGYDVKGNPIIISGNHNRRVGIETMPNIQLLLIDTYR